MGTQWDWRAQKVQPWHRERWAVVYVRQSSPHQVLHHQESARLQYGLGIRAQDLGWTTERVLVIDDDQATSGSTAEGRLGFQQLVSEVSLGHIGIILGFEVARMARSCTDWYRLLELCALFGTLIADLDGIYDPAQYNDRLLLGLKGTMSEAELHIMQQRLRQGLLAKARRGDLRVAVPMGYIRRASGEVSLDPDEQVQHVVRLIFRKFEELGTLNAVLRYLVEHGIQLGLRGRDGELDWRRPNRHTLQNLLKHPIYAGAYAYGRRQVDRRRAVPGKPGTGRRTMERDQWLAFLPDRVPSYISWEQYERNVRQLAANRARADTRGVVRGGTALLTGLLVCGRCGCRLDVSYDGRGTHHLYVCNRRKIEYAEPSCQELAGPCLDRFVSAQVLVALEPAALELSLEAAQQLEGERDDLDRLWRERRERAAYEAERAQRQYALVEPEHRLVARSLERAWEEKLATRQQLDEEYHRFLTTQPRILTESERMAIRQLAADIPALWEATTTTVTERKEIIRQVVHRVVVAVQGESERVQVTIDWVGGDQTVAEIVRPVARLEQLSYYPQLSERARQLAQEGLTAGAIAERLDAEGYRPPKRRERFGRRGVRDLLRRLGAGSEQPHRTTALDLGTDEWSLRQLAQAIGMPEVTLYNWLYRGWVMARREEEAPHRWIIWADDAEVARLRQRHQRSLGDEAHHRWCAKTPNTVTS
jgi:DNA invertase Pin-like site-specific DNA recombinase